MTRARHTHALAILGLALIASGRLGVGSGPGAQRERRAGRHRRGIVQPDRREPAEDAVVLRAARAHRARGHREPAAAVLVESAAALDAGHQRRQRAPRQRAHPRRLHAGADRVRGHRPRAPRGRGSRTRARSRWSSTCATWTRCWHRRRRPACRADAGRQAGGHRQRSRGADRGPGWPAGRTASGRAAAADERARGRATSSPRGCR